MLQLLFWTIQGIQDVACVNRATSHMAGQARLLRSMKKSPVCSWAAVHPGRIYLFLVDPSRAVDWAAETQALPLGLGQMNVLDVDLQAFFTISNVAFMLPRLSRAYVAFFVFQVLIIYFLHRAPLRCDILRRCTSCRELAVHGPLATRQQSWFSALRCARFSLHHVLFIISHNYEKLVQVM